jgi:Xaa-Pro aminopeptidase
VFPQSGEVTAIFSSARECEMWKDLQHWIVDMRWGKPASLVVDRVKELAPSGTIGVSNLRGTYHLGGTVPYEAWSEVLKGLPNVALQAQNTILDLARMVKGPEEVALLEKVTAANEAAIQVMWDTARPGVAEATVWSAMAAALVQATGEFPCRLSIATNREGNSTNTMACPYVIPPGGVMTEEIAARMAGYQAQSNHSFGIGQPMRPGYEKAMSIACDVYASLLAWIRPGKTIGDLVSEYRRLLEQHGCKATGVAVHTNGLGADRPRLGPSMGTPQDDLELVIEPGFTFTTKPSARLEDGSMAQLGDPLTVTETGARRLGKRPLAPKFV